MKTVAAVLFLALTASRSFPQSTVVHPTRSADMNVFGLHLGAKLTLPECTRDSNYYKVRADSEAQTRKMIADTQLQQAKHAEAETARLSTMSSTASAGELANEKRHADSTATGMEQTARILAGHLADEEKMDTELPVAYAEDQPVTCFEWRGSFVKSDTSIATDTVWIKFPSGQSPAIVSAPPLYAGVIDGNLESMSIYTTGVRSQDYTLSELQRKYGKPSELHKVAKQNTFGAVFNCYVARWTFSDLSIEFNGATDKLDEGTVTIGTKKGEEARTATLNKSRNGPKL